MILHDQFEPAKLLAVTRRVREWVDSAEPSQLREDVHWLLRSHFDYYRRYLDTEKRLWWQQDTEDNGGIAISWQERAEELEKKLKAVQEALEA